MPNVITGLAPTTELEAVNAMLATIGEAILPANTDLSSASLGADAALAVETLRSSTRELLSMPWRFNSESGVQVPPTAQYSWVDTAGQTTLLNVFKVPTGVLSFRQTECLENGALDLIERVSKKYQELGGTNVKVLYDRTFNRDGAEASAFPFVYLDVLWSVDFVNLPESARKFVTDSSAVLLAQRALGSQQLSQFASQSAAFSYRILQREQGLPRKLNILDNSNVRAVMGQRPSPRGGAWMRVYPGSV